MKLLKYVKTESCATEQSVKSLSSKESQLSLACVTQRGFSLENCAAYVKTHCGNVICEAKLNYTKQHMLISSLNNVLWLSRQMYNS